MVSIVLLALVESLVAKTTVKSHTQEILSSGGTENQLQMSSPVIDQTAIASDVRTGKVVGQGDLREIATSVGSTTQSVLNKNYLDSVVLDVLGVVALPALCDGPCFHRFFRDMM